MDKNKFLKRAFKYYNENKKRLREYVPPGVSSVDLTKIKTRGSNPQAAENSIVKSLDEKTEIEKQIEIVNRALWFYELNNDDGKCAYIRFRWFKCYTVCRSAMECYISESTAARWEKDIIKTAARCADLFGLWG